MLKVASSIFISFIIGAMPAFAWALSLEDILAEKGLIAKSAEQKNADEEVRLYWSKGWQLEFPQSGNSIGLALLMQERYTFWDNQDSSNVSSFEISKAKLAFSASLLDNEFSVSMDPDFVGDGGGDGQSAKPSLKDAYISWNANKSLSFDLGQFKTFVSKQYVTSDWKGEFPERSIASDYFSMGRQEGAALNYKSEDSKWQLKAAVFNGLSSGEGANRPGLDTKELVQVGARVNPLGQIDVRAEGDVDYSESLGLSLGTALSRSEALEEVSDNLPSVDMNMNSYNFDANLKYRGLALAAEYYLSSTAAAGPYADSLAQGFYLQSGYFFIPKKVEFVVRYSMVDCDSGKAGGSCSGNSSINEASAALTYMWLKHQLKMTLAYSALLSNALQADAQGEDSNRWILQLSSCF